MAIRFFGNLREKRSRGEEVGGGFFDGSSEKLASCGLVAEAVSVEAIIDFAA